jgi:hypothetical protein
LSSLILVKFARFIKKSFLVGAEDAIINASIVYHFYFNVHSVHANHCIATAFAIAHLRVPAPAVRLRKSSRDHRAERACFANTQRFRTHPVHTVADDADQVSVELPAKEVQDLR